MPRTLRSRLLPVIALTAVAALVLLIPWPGGMSVSATRAVVGMFAWFPGADLVSDVGLVVLAAGVLAGLAVAWRRPQRWPSVFAAVGVVVAYGASEVLKVVFAEPRPCTAWNLPTECPPVGDWSFPSNHATLAFGAVVVIVVAVQRAWAMIGGLAIALIVAISRIAAGAHYLHDVAAGAVIGVALPLLAVLIAYRVRNDAGTEARASRMRAESPSVSAARGRWRR